MAVMSDNTNPMSASMKIANCACCTLADVMKDCARCPFNIGLGFKGIKQAEKSIVYTKPVQFVTNK